MIWSGGTKRTGVLFCSLTTTVKLPVSLNGGEPLSVTPIVKRLVLGSCSATGVQVSTPLLGSRLAPVGAEIRLNVNGLCGTSGSVTKLVTIIVASPWIALFRGTVST